MSIKTILISKLYYFFGLIMVLLTPIEGALIAIGVLIGIDFTFGLIAAAKSKVKITSKKMSQSIIKMFVYQLLIIASFITMTYLIPWFPLVKITIAFIGMTEFLSIGESFQRITGLEFVKYIKDYLMRHIKKYSDDQKEKG